MSFMKALTLYCPIIDEEEEELLIKDPARSHDNLALLTRTGGSEDSSDEAKQVGEGEEK